MERPNRQHPDGSGSTGEHRATTPRVPLPRTESAPMARMAPPGEAPAPAPVAPDEVSGGPRRVTVVLMTAVLVVALAGLAAVSWQLLSRDNEPAVVPGASATGEPPPPVALPANGSYVRTTVLPNGDLDVEHWIRTPGVSRVTLSVPALAVPGQLRASGVEVMADGRRLFGRDTIGQAVRTHYLNGAKSIYVRYVLEGAVERSGSAGRGLARVTSLDVLYDAAGGTSTRVIEGVDVRALACFPTGSKGAAPRSCGATQGGLWQVDLSGADRDDRVMAQFDQP